MTKQKKTEEIGSRIRELRKWLRISQNAVGNFLDVPRSAISAIESGKREIGAQEIMALSRLFRCDPNSLLGVTKTPVDFNELSFKTRTNHPEQHLDEHDYRELIGFRDFLIEKYKRAPSPILINPKDLVKSKLPQQAAEELRNKLKVGCPVDIFSIIEKIGLYPRFTALAGLAGAIVRAQTDGEEIFGILINSDQSEERTRFSAAHEVAHYVLEHLQKDEKYHPSPKARWRSPVETDADSFAAELLVPRKELAKEIEPKKEFNALVVQELADHFLVSYQAMLYRLLEHRYISKVQFDEFFKEKPSELRAVLQKGKKKKAYEFDTKSLKTWINQKSENPEFVNSPDWIRFIQEAACFEYWKKHQFNERATEVKDLYEQVAIWIAENNPPKLN